ncbi:MAG TPA: hypothetical protein VGN42_04965 [Pirellulales bacterium]|jgi:hypothetical protein|nr:hypothetical protein [Pirellulales bacterium]
MALSIPMPQRGGYLFGLTRPSPVLAIIETIIGFSSDGQELMGVA